MKKRSKETAKTTTTAKRSPELKTSVLFNDGSGGAWAIGEYISARWGLHLPDIKEAYSLPLGEVFDAWTSSNGSTYLASWGNQHPIIRCENGKFEYVSIELPGKKTIGPVKGILGASGTTPSDDTLYAVSEPYVINKDPSCTFLWRENGTWQCTPLPRGEVLALTQGDDGSITISISYIMRETEKRGGLLLRVVNGEIETLVFPPLETVVPTRAVGLHVTPQGDLLVLFSSSWEQPARPWLRTKSGAWSKIKAAPLVPWLGHIRSRSWRGRIYLAAENGIFVLDEKNKIRQESTFLAQSFWPWGDALVCVGWESEPAHKINRGGKWEPFFVPAPDTVFGGRGKSVELGPKNKVPVVKVRMRAPAPSTKETPKPSAKSSPFSLKLFLKQLEKRKGVTRRKHPTPTVKNLESHLGTQIAPDLRSFFELYGSHSIGGQIGMWQPWPDTYFAPPNARGSLTELVKSVYVEFPTLVAAFTNTIYLGSDGSGQVYFAQVHANGSEVFVYGPGVGELKFLADSFTTFAELNDVDDQWQTFCSNEGGDVEDLKEGEMDVSSPEFVRIRKAARALEGRVHLTGFEKSNLSSEFDDTLPAVADMKFRAASKSRTLELFARANWLNFALSQYAQVVSSDGAPGGAPRAKDAIVHDRAADRKKNPELASLAATKVYWLWHHFLLDEKAELKALIKETLKDPSDLVRATGQLMRALCGTDPLPRELEALRGLRAATLKELASPGSFEIDKKRKEQEKIEARKAPLRKILKPDASDNKSIKDLKKKIAKDLESTDLWDQLIFALYEADLPLKMLEAADARLGIEHDYKNYYPWFEKGTALYMLDRYAEAIAPLEQALQRNSENANIWMNKSLVHAALKDRANALLHLREAVRRDKGFKTFAKNDAMFKEWLNDPEFRKIVK